MKVAVIVYGMLRELDTAVKTWNFLNHPDFDFYFSTWSESYQINEKLGVDIREEINEDMIKKHIPNANISILNESDFVFPGDIVYQNDKLIFHQKNGLKMVKDSGIKYDMLMLTRSDNYKTFYFGAEHFFTMNKKDRIYGQTAIYVSNLETFFLQDYFFVGDFDVMSEIIEAYPDTLPSNIHNFLAHQIIKLGYFVEDIKKFDVCLARPTLRGLSNINRDIVAEKFREWGENTNNNKK
jgi:hypothetical protein